MLMINVIAIISFTLICFTVSHNIQINTISVVILNIPWYASSMSPSIANSAALELDITPNSFLPSINSRCAVLRTTRVIITFTSSKVINNRATIILHLFPFTTLLALICVFMVNVLGLNLQSLQDLSS